MKIKIYNKNSIQINIDIENEESKFVHIWNENSTKKLGYIYINPDGEIKFHKN